MKIRDTAEPTMSREEMADDYARLKREYTLLHQDYRRAIRKQCDIHVVSQQRELLKRFIDYINYLQATAEDIPYTDIDVFLERFNCG